MKPRVSVVMATYDGGRFVGAAVESVIAQTCPGVELIVCDDGSRDDTRAVLATFGERVRVLHQANAGVSAARNAAAAEAQGEFLAFLDQDDAYEPEMLERQLALLATDPDLAFVYADSLVVDQDDRVCGRRGEHLVYASGDVLVPLLAGNFVPLETLVMRLDLFRALGGFRADLKLLEDWDLCLRAARRGRAALAEGTLARYRIHDANLSHDTEALVREYSKVLDELASDRTLPAHALASVERERARRHGELAWYALKRVDLEEVRAWLAREPRARKPLKLSLLHAAARVLPVPATRALLRLLPRKRLYGVSHFPPPGAGGGE